MILRVYFIKLNHMYRPPEEFRPKVDLIIELFIRKILISVSIM